MKPIHILRASLILGPLLGGAAQAHVVLDRPQARAGAYHRADLVVGHG